MENIEHNIENYEDIVLALFAEAYAYYPEMRNDLNKLYDTNKYQAYRLAKSSVVYEHDLFKHGGLEKEIYCKRALGLLLLSYENENMRKSLIELIRKNRPKLYSVCKSTDTNKIISYLVDIQNKELPAVQKSDLYLGLYLYYNDSIKINIDLVNSENSHLDGRLLFLQYAIESIKSSMISSELINNKEILLKDNHDQICGILNRINENYGQIHCYEDIYRQSDESIKKYQTIFSLIFDFERLSISNIMNSIEIDANDINEIILAYRLLYKDKNLERTTNVLINGIIIKTLIKAYKEVKAAYFENNKETLFFNIEEKDKEILKLKEENEKLKINLKEIEDKLSVSEKHKNNQISKINSNNQIEISMLMKQIKKFELASDKFNEDVNELNKLRELLFEIENRTEFKEVEENLATYLIGKKVMIVGGHQDWRQKISNKYSNVLTIDGFKENFEKQILIEMDVVLFNTGYMSHKAYYKIIDYIRKNKIPFGYLKTTNIDLVETEIINTLTNLKS